MAAHTCETCGLLHDAPVTEAPEAVEVTIARIQADRDIAVARYAARQDADYNETRVEVAKIEAKADVESAAIEGEVIAAAIEASDVPEAEPVEYVAPDLVIDNEAVNEDAPPEPEGSPVPETTTKTSFGMW
jgi:hypothetical protein